MRRGERRCLPGAVVFDLDGTLYDPRRLRLLLLPALLAAAARPGGWLTLRILARFRAERERLADEEAAGIRRLQYERPAAALRVTPAAVESVVGRWMRERPLGLLRRCRYPGVGLAMAHLRRVGAAVAILSDYEAAAKLTALGLVADLTVSAEDPEVDRLKPHPAGLALLLARLAVAPEQAVLIGDRDERDGECARRLGVPYQLKVRRPGADPRRFHDYRRLVSTWG